MLLFQARSAPLCSFFRQRSAPLDTFKKVSCFLPFLRCLVQGSIELTTLFQKIWDFHNGQDYNLNFHGVASEFLGIKYTQRYTRLNQGPKMSKNRLISVSRNELNCYISVKNGSRQLVLSTQYYWANKRLQVQKTPSKHVTGPSFEQL